MRWSARTIAGGRRIVIAHPERYRYPAGLDAARRHAALAGAGRAAAGERGKLHRHYRDHRPESESLAWAMVQEGMVDIIGSDHHGPRRAGVSPLEAFEALCAENERAAAVRAMVERPAAVLRDEPVEETGASVPVRTRSAGA